LGKPLSFYPFDTRFVGPKPRNEVDPVWLKATEAAGALGIFRKYDGYGALVPITTHTVDLYSRTCTKWTGRFPAIEADLAGMRIPSETLLAGEMTVDHKGRNDMDLFGRFARSGIETSIALQRNYNPVQLRLFNVLVYNGRDVSGLPYGDRLSLLEDLCARSSGFVSTIRELGVSFEAAKRLVRKNKWEGLVLYDMRAGTKFRVDGNAKIPLRPEGCVKWKPIVEDDFVATGWVPSDSTSFAGLVRDLIIGQYDPVTKKLIDCGRVGTGLSHADKKRLTDSSLYPFVVQVKFECRTEKHKLKKASIMRIRDDKKPEECVHPYTVAA
jgi:bifunctional non-homologous end joining protein LigD